MGFLVETLASFALEATLRQAPPAIQNEVRRAAFNWIGCTVGGSQREATTIALRAVKAISGTGRASVLGSRDKLDCSNAAFINCIASSVDAFDDTDATMMLHPTSPVAAAAFAVAEQVGASGSEFLDALLAGMEIEYRLCTALAKAPARPRIGFYLSGLTGVVGAAAACARLLKLDKERTIGALTVAATGAAGFQEALSSMCCPFIPANASRNGVFAALLAQEGFHGKRSTFEGERGFFKVFCEESNIPAVVEGLGSRFLLETITYKPYPCGIVIHAALDACLDVLADPAFSVNKVKRVRLNVEPLTINLCGHQPAPRDALEGQVSAHHWVAATLLSGHGGIQNCEPATFGNAQIAQLRKRIELIPDSRIRREEVVAQFELEDGTVLSRHIENCRGSIANPMTDEDLTHKFRSYGSLTLTPHALDKLIDAAWNLGSRARIGEIATLAQGKD
jgi:2-methylcitrate dehydratase PrpD